MASVVFDPSISSIPLAHSPVIDRRPNGKYCFVTSAESFKLAFIALICIVIADESTVLPNFLAIAKTDDIDDEEEKRRDQNLIAGLYLDFAHLSDKQKRTGANNPRSLILISRITKALLVHGALSKTNLAYKANVHYARLQIQLRWLEDRKYISYEQLNNIELVRLTEEGILFSRTLHAINDL